MKLQRVNNAEIISTVLRDSGYWERYGEDGVDPEALVFDPRTAAALAITSDEGDITCLVLAQPLTPSIWTVRYAVVQYSKDLIGYISKALAYLIASFGARKLVMVMPVDDKQGMRLAQRTGFQREGVCKRSFLKNGELKDQYYLGVTSAD